MRNTISIQAMFSLTNELAYLIGVCLSDGWLRFSEEFRTYQFGLKSIDKDFIDNVNKASKIVINHTGNIREIKENGKMGKQQQYEIAICHKKFVEFLKQITVDKTIIPEIIMQANNEIKLWFVRGVMDSDGWISRSKQGFYQIGMAKTKKYLIDGIIRLFTDLGIRIGKTTKGQTKYGLDIWTIRWKKPYLINPFTIQRKQKRFRDYTRKFLEGNMI